MLCTLKQLHVSAIANNSITGLHTIQLYSNSNCNHSDCYVINVFKWKNQILVTFLYFQGTMTPTPKANTNQLKTCVHFKYIILEISFLWGGGGGGGTRLKFWKVYVTTKWKMGGSGASQMAWNRVSEGFFYLWNYSFKWAAFFRSC